MDALGGNLLRQAETLLREGNRQAALPLLAEYLQHYPRSARGWWMLGLAVNDPRQQAECLEHVLEIDPGYAPARARLEKLRPRTEPPIPPAFEPLPPSQPTYAFDEPPTPSPVRSTVRRAPPKKATWVLPAVVGLILALALFGVVGVIVIWNMQRTTLAAPLPMSSLVARTLEPTWTPTASATLRPTFTPIPTQTPLPPLTLLDTGEYATAIQNPVGQPVFGSPATDFTLSTLDGERVSLGAYRGQAVLLFFWATWCPYCRNEVAALRDLHSTYKDQGLAILAVEVGENAATGRAFRDEYNLPFTILNDANSDVFRSYGGQAFPTNYFIDSTGSVTYTQVGMMDYASLNVRVRALLNLIPTPVR